MWEQFKSWMSSQLADLRNGNKADLNAALAALPKPDDSALRAELTTAQNALKDEQGRVTALTNEKVQLSAQVTTLGAEKTDLTGKLTAAEKNLSDTQANVTAATKDLAAKCLAWGAVLELKDAEGKALPADAKAEDKQAAAERLPLATLISASATAVTEAMTKAGVDVSKIPSAPAASSGGQSAEPKAALEAYNKITDPTSRLEFYRKNRAAIDAAHRL